MKKIFLLLNSVCVLGILGLALFSRPVFSAGPRLYLYPKSGYAVLNKDFSVDIMIDTGGVNTTTTRAVFRFDPDKITVTKAQHGDLYCQYPEDGYTVDNTDGWVVLTGFCLDPYYNSGSKDGLFGRVTFRPLVEGEVALNFEFNGIDEEWKSVVKNTGSPPQNILLTRPDGGSYTLVSKVPSGSTDTGDLPGVGIVDNKVLIVGFVLVGLAFLIMVVDVVFRGVRQASVKRNARTVVVQ